MNTTNLPRDRSTLSIRIEGDQSITRANDVSDKTSFASVVDSSPFILMAKQIVVDSDESRITLF